MNIALIQRNPMLKIRQPDSNDLNKIYALYKKVATETTGLARSGDEITDQYIQEIMKSASETGLQFIVDHPNSSNQIIAEVHCYKLLPKVFSHVLSELTIAVDPDFHGQGIGKMIFTHLLNFITKNRTDIMRVELISRESNTKAISFYESLGFNQEGRFEKRIGDNSSNEFEADIPMAWFNPNYKKSN